MGELEFAQQSMPYTRQIAALEQKLAKQEQQIGEREAAAERCMAAVQAREDTLQRELETKAARDALEQQEEAKRRSAAQAEMEQFKLEASQAVSALEAAYKEKQASEQKGRILRDS